VYIYIYIEFGDLFHLVFDSFLVFFFNKVIFTLAVYICKIGIRCKIYSSMICKTAFLVLRPIFIIWQVSFLSHI